MWLRAPSARCRWSRARERPPRTSPRAVSESAEQAEQTAEVATQARETAQHGVAAADQANEAMNSVRDSSHAVTGAIRELAAKSEQIGAIVADDHRDRRADQPARAQRRDRGRPRRRAGPRLRGRRRGGPQARRGVPARRRGDLGADRRDPGRDDEGSRGGRGRRAQTDDGASVVEQTREAFQQIGRGRRHGRPGRADRRGRQQITARDSMQASIGEVAASPSSPRRRPSRSPHRPRRPPRPPSRSRPPPRSSPATPSSSTDSSATSNSRANRAGQAPGLPRSSELLLASHHSAIPAPAGSPGRHQIATTSPRSSPGPAQCGIRTVSPAVQLAHPAGQHELSHSLHRHENDQITAVELGNRIGRDPLRSEIGLCRVRKQRAHAATQLAWPAQHRLELALS